MKNRRQRNGVDLVYGAGFDLERVSWVLADDINLIFTDDRQCCWCTVSEL